MTTPRKLDLLLINPASRGEVYQSLGRELAGQVLVSGDPTVNSVADNTTLTVLDLLLATDAQAVNGLLYNGNAARRGEANTVYGAVNQQGGI